jgi:thiaminase/transcriptional activator TenA
VIATEGSLFGRLRAAAAGEWDGYTRHEFVRRLGDGSLPEACFRRYLIQDYLFLIQFARAYALAAYKSETLADIRDAAHSVAAIADTEMSLHVTYCAGWGLTEDDLAGAPEATATMAYTRYVLEKGASGDLLDLYVALAPCIVGYAEIGTWLRADPDTRTEGNAYAAWIDMYAGADYQEVAKGAVEQLDRLERSRAGPGRFDALARTFRQATRLEIAFWDMGLSP